MRDYWLGLKFMLSYFTILPVRFDKNDDLSKPQVLSSMLLFFPLGGLLIGSMAVGLLLLLSPLSWLASIVAAVGYMMLYGFLHTEAIMDVTDALYASHSSKDPYAIIKEPTVGAMGVLWAGGLSLLKIAAIVYLFTHQAYALFLGILLVSRLGLLMLFYTQTFRSTFLTTLKHTFSREHMIASLILFSMVGTILNGSEFLVLLFLGLLSSYLVTRWLRHRLSFINGDVLGTTLEVTEILLLLIGALLWL